MSTEMSEIDLLQLKPGEHVEFDLADLFKRNWFDRYQLRYWGSAASRPEYQPKTPFFMVDKANGQRLFMGSEKGTRNLISEYISERKAPVLARLIKEEDISLLARLSVVSHGISSSGWDPEIFVEDADSSLIPAFDFLPPKNKGVRTGPGTASAYFDGFVAEFTTPPAVCHEMGIDHVRSGLKTVLKYARSKFHKAKLSLKNVYRIPEGKLLQTAEEHVALGCNPSLNVYGKPSFFTENPRLLPYRVAGGHVHFQLSMKSKKEIVRAIQGMDLIAGMVTVALFEGIDDPLRREYYGRAGEYRKTPYGIEYRTLSNAWLGDPRISHLVMEIARLSLGLRNIPDLHSQMGITPERVQEIINFCDVKGARAFLNSNEMTVNQLLFPRLQSESKFWEIVNGGVLSKLPQFTDVERNWELHRAWSSYNDGHRVNWKGYCNGTAVYK